MTGFIPAGEIQSMHMHDSPGLPSGNSINSSELMKGKVQGERCGRPRQTGRLGHKGAWTLHCGRSQPEKIPPDPHLEPIFWPPGAGLRKASAQGTGRERLASEAIGKLGSSGLTTWTTYKFPF